VEQVTQTDFTVRRFSDDFARILRDRILSGDLKAGQRLNEVRLSETYGISRTPIREALQALAAEGLVLLVAGRGAYVGGLTADEVRELGQVREALESQAARMVAADAAEADLARLEATVGAAGSGAEQEDFHAVLLSITGNRHLEQLGSATAAKLRLARSHSATRPGRVDEAISEHRAILQAIRAGDPAAAESAMRAHIEQATANAAAVAEA
jgi:DNA-binding GntR family transcriptional regulator